MSKEQSNKYGFPHSIFKKVTPVFHDVEINCNFLGGQYLVSTVWMRQVKKNTFRVFCFALFSNKLNMQTQTSCSIGRCHWCQQHVQQWLELCGSVKPRLPSWLSNEHGKYPPFTSLVWHNAFTNPAATTIFAVDFPIHVNRSGIPSTTTKHLLNKARFKEVLWYTNHHINLGSLEIPFRENISPSNVVAMTQATVQEHRHQSSHWHDPNASGQVSAATRFPKQIALEHQAWRWWDADNKEEQKDLKGL